MNMHIITIMAVVAQTDKDLTRITYSSEVSDSRGRHERGEGSEGMCAHLAIHRNSVCCATTPHPAQPAAKMRAFECMS